jgi:hypothetical protein
MTLRVYDPSALRLRDESFLGLQKEDELCDCFSGGHEFCIEFCHFTRDTPIPFTITMYFNTLHTYLLLLHLPSLPTPECILALFFFHLHTGHRGYHHYAVAFVAGLSGVELATRSTDILMLNLVMGH